VTASVQKKLINPIEVEVAEEGPAGDSQKLLKNWAGFLSAVKKRNITLEALLRSAKPIKDVNGTCSSPSFLLNFYKEQLELPKFRTMILDCAAPIAGGRVKIEYELSNTPKKADLVEPKVASDLATLAEEVLV